VVRKRILVRSVQRVFLEKIVQKLPFYEEKKGLGLRSSHIMRKKKGLGLRSSHIMRKKRVRT
jgi:hypothetical protein